jgi:hypothetical protein
LPGNAKDESLPGISNTIQNNNDELYSSLWDIPQRNMIMQAKMEYDASVDMKKRITLRGSRYSHYHVVECEDGKIILEPRVLVSPFELSKNTLSVMDSSMENYKKGTVSKPVDLSSLPQK